MSFRDIKTHLKHILEARSAITSLLEGSSLEAYWANLITKSAVERLLQNLTEAGIRPGRDAEKLCPTVDWAAIRGFGNALRHEYDVIDDEVIWSAIHDKLPFLQVAVRRALASHQESKEDPA